LNQELKMNICTLNLACMRVIVLMTVSLRVAGASELVYTPINPSFGGNPGNGPNLMGIAAAQNGHKAPPTTPLTPLQRFNNSLQQAVLNQLATQIKDTIFGTGGTTITPGTYNAGNYVVTVIQNADGSLTISTTDKTNGSTATFDVSTAM
jgi:curli production assembly/transport component CsgF